MTIFPRYPFLVYVLACLLMSSGLTALWYYDFFYPRQNHRLRFRCMASTPCHYGVDMWGPNGEGRYVEYLRRHYQFEHEVCDYACVSDENTELEIEAFLHQYASVKSPWTDEDRERYEDLKKREP